MEETQIFQWQAETKKQKHTDETHRDINRNRWNRPERGVHQRPTTKTNTGAKRPRPQYGTVRYIQPTHTQTNNNIQSGWNSNTQFVSVDYIFLYSCAVHSSATCCCISPYSPIVLSLSLSASSSILHLPVRPIPLPLCFIVRLAQAPLRYSTILPHGRCWEGQHLYRSSLSDLPPHRA